MNTALVLSTLVVALALAACKPAETSVASPRPDEPAVDTPQIDAAASAPSAPAPSSAPVVPARRAVPAKPTEVEQAILALNQIGIAECDHFLTRVATCLRQMPDAERARHRQSLLIARQGWVQAAASGRDRMGIGQSCRVRLEQSRATYAVHGCTL